MPRAPLPRPSTSMYITVLGKFTAELYSRCQNFNGQWFLQDAASPHTFLISSVYVQILLQMFAFSKLTRFLNPVL